MQILDAFQQTLDAVMEKTGDVKDVEDEAEKLLERMNGHNAALTKILLESPTNVLQGAEEQMVPPILQHAVAPGLICNVCNIGLSSIATLVTHKAGGYHMKRAYTLAPVSYTHLTLPTNREV